MPSEAVTDTVADNVGRVLCPVFVVHGNNDKIVPPASSEELAKALTSAASVAIARISMCGNVPHEETPQPFVAAVLQFLRAVQSSHGLPPRGPSVSIRVDADGTVHYLDVDNGGADEAGVEDASSAGGNGSSASPIPHSGGANNNNNGLTPAQRRNMAGRGGGGGRKGDDAKTRLLE